MSLPADASACPPDHAAAHRPPRAWWWSLILFLAVFGLLQAGWEAARGTALERLVVHEATVGTVAAAVRLITPEIDARAVGARVAAPGGGLNVLQGCEGTEVFFLLVAALAAHPLRWKVRLVGLLAGAAVVFVLNEMRLLALFYSYRLDRSLFDQLHGLVTPLVLVVLTLGYFLVLLRWNDRTASGGSTLAGQAG